MPAGPAPTTATLRGRRADGDAEESSSATTGILTPPRAGAPGLLDAARREVARPEVARGGSQPQDRSRSRPLTTYWLSTTWPPATSGGLVQLVLAPLALLAPASQLSSR